MTPIQSYAVFTANFPPDSKEVNGEIVMPAGRNIIIAICDFLQSSGTVTTQPTQYSFYGWVSEFATPKARVWMLIQEADPWLLIVEARCSWLSGTATRLETLIFGVQLIKDALGSDARFMDVRWMTKQEFESAKRGGRAD